MNATPERVVHEKETISLDSATIEQCKALIVACEARIEMVKRDQLRMLRENIKQLALAEGMTTRDLLKSVLDGEERRGEAVRGRQRRSPGEAMKAQIEEAKRKRYYDPVSKTGWNGHGRVPLAFIDKATGQIDRNFLSSCTNPDYDPDYEASHVAAE